MADIAAAGVGTWTFVDLGNKKMAFCQIQGDGSGVTLPVPLGRIEAAWHARAGKATVESQVLTITWATNIITFSAAPTDDLYTMVFVIGW